MVRVGNDSESNFFGTRVPAVHNTKVPATVRESFRVFWTDVRGQIVITLLLDPSETDLPSRTQSEYFLYFYILSVADQNENVTKKCKKRLKCHSKNTIF